MTPIVIDLEWNHPQPGQARLADLPGEIIQIGAVKIDEACNVLDTFALTIKPTYYKKINKFIQELTLITDKDLAAGTPFVEAIESFKKWCGDDFVFLSWGRSDIIELERNCLKFGISLDWLPKSYDAQLMFDDMEMDEGRDFPLNYALYHFNERPDGAHNALADALSTVLILKHLDLAEGLNDDYFRTDSLPEEGEEKGETKE